MILRVFVVISKFHIEFLNVLFFKVKSFRNSTLNAFVIWILISCLDRHKNSVATFAYLFHMNHSKEIKSKIIACLWSILDTRNLSPSVDRMGLFFVWHARPHLSNISGDKIRDYDVDDDWCTSRASIVVNKLGAAL